MTSPVDRFRVSGEGGEEFEISSDGWLYLERSLDWTHEDHYVMMVKWLHSACGLQAQICIFVELTAAIVSRLRH